MHKLSKQKIIELHSYMIEMTGGLDGVRDENMLDLAISSPFQTFGGQDLYPNDIDKICKLAFNLTTLHCFFDGNKRIGAFILLINLKLDGFEFIATDNEIVSTFLLLATNKINYEGFKDWVISKITFKKEIIN